MMRHATLLFSLAIFATTLASVRAQSVVSITTPDGFAEEGTDTGSFQISRDGGTNTSPLTVELTIDAPGTSASPSDYSLDQPIGAVVIPAGASSVQLVLTAIDDRVAEAEEELTLRVAPSPTYTVGALNVSAVLIEQNDFVVANTNDFNPNTGPDTPADREGTLRQAIENANQLGGDPTIEFDDFPFLEVPPNTIVLTGGEIPIESGLTIAGPGADHVTIQGFDLRRIFRIDEFDEIDVTISGVTLEGGTAFTTGPEGLGGAILAGAEDPVGVDLTLTECAFIGNRGIQGGAIAFNSPDGRLRIERCLFADNTASTEGGAVAYYDGQAIDIQDSTFALNSSDGGAGAVVIGSDGTNVITNATIVGNRCDAGDGGLTTDIGGGLLVSGGTTCTLNNCVIAGNLRGTSTPAPNDIGGIADPASRNNLIGDPATAGSLSHASNILGDVDNGTALPLNRIVQTELVDPTVPLLDNHGGPTDAVRLSPGSAAIDSGDPALASTSGFDQRGDGFPRVQSGSGFGFGSIDRGALEYDPILVTTNVDEDDGTTDPSVGAGTSLREAIVQANDYPGLDLIVFSTGTGGTTNFFDPGSPKTIALNSELVVTGAIVIDGPGAELLKLDGDVDGSGTANLGDTRLLSFLGPFLGPAPRNRLSGLTIYGGSNWSEGFLESGGGIINFATRLFVIDCVFENNTAADGGAIFNDGTLNLFNVSISGNDADQGGGLYTTGFIGVQRTTFVGNNATTEGGGIYANAPGSSLSILNTTLASNSASTGGGLFLNEGNARLANCTIAENSSSTVGTGGGIHFSGATSAALELDNTIVIGNIAGTSVPLPSDIAGGGVAPGSVHNLIGDAATSGGLVEGADGNLVGDGGTGTIMFEAVLSPLDDYGGDNLTYALAADSPALDSGGNSSASFSTGLVLSTDQRGFPRFSGAAVDVGSVERQTLPEPILDPIGDFFELEFTLLEFTATATIPGGGATPVFSLEDGEFGFVPSGAFIDPATGDFEWVTDLAGFYEFDVVVARSDDPTSIDRETIIIEVESIGPVLDPIGNMSAVAGTPLSFTATLASGGFSTVEFSLDTASEAAGMTIDISTGDFTWTPTAAQAPGSYPVTITVTEMGDATLSDSASFSIDVSPPAALPIVSLDNLGVSIVHEPASYTKSPPLPTSALNFGITRNTTMGDLTVVLQLDGATIADPSEYTMTYFPSGTPMPLIFTGSSPTASITIADGETTMPVLVEALDDAAAEADELISISILPQPASYAISGSGTTTQTIAQNDYTVTQLADFDPATEPDIGEGTLRQAVINAKAGLSMAPSTPLTPAQIDFLPGLTGEIVLTEGALWLDTADFSITGPGDELIAVSGGSTTRAFIVYDTAGDRSYSISDLTIRDGITARNGGGIFNTETLVLEECTITGCFAANGGAISSEGTLTMERCAVIGNGATVYGGGIDNHSGSALVTDCSIVDNTADFGGGIENTDGANLELVGCAIAGNTAASSGGGIDCFASDLSLTNCTVSGNAAAYGGGILNESGNVSIVLSTVAANTASVTTGGLLSSSNPPTATAVLHNTIIAGNGGGDIASDDTAFVDPLPASSFNVIGDAASAGGLINGVGGNIVGADLGDIVGPLADNGGTTATHALAAASPAIDAGNNALVPAGLASDGRGTGFARIVGGVVDIGAYEQEAIAGLAIAAIEFSPAPRRATVSWNSRAGARYRVLRSTDMETWTVLADDVLAVGALTSATDPAPPEHCACYVIEER